MLMVLSPRYLDVAEAFYRDLHPAAVINQVQAAAAPTVLEIAVQHATAQKALLFSTHLQVGTNSHAASFYPCISYDSNLSGTHICAVLSTICYQQNITLIFIYPQPVGMKKFDDSLERTIDERLNLELFLSIPAISIRTLQGGGDLQVSTQYPVPNSSLRF